ncbi:Protein of unknown function [Gryllus bimaculatus]|nr:Protein of unknown function [Gryllus bimaculatus]
MIHKGKAEVDTHPRAPLTTTLFVQERGIEGGSYPLLTSNDHPTLESRISTSDTTKLKKYKNILTCTSLQQPKDTLLRISRPHATYAVHGSNIGESQRFSLVYFRWAAKTSPISIYLACNEKSDMVSNGIEQNTFGGQIPLVVEV